MLELLMGSYRKLIGNASDEEMVAPHKRIIPQKMQASPRKGTQYSPRKGTRSSPRITKGIRMKAPPRKQIPPKPRSPRKSPPSKCVFRQSNLEEVEHALVYYIEQYFSYDHIEDRRYLVWFKTGPDVYEYMWVAADEYLDTVWEEQGIECRVLNDIVNYHEVVCTNLSPLPKPHWADRQN